MTTLLTEFQSLISARPNRPSRDWTNIDCPACGDTRKRGGFATTPTGGFRYSCFNGGCEFNGKATGWEPGAGLGGRVRQLFTMLGGDVSRIPPKERMKQTKPTYDANGNVIGHEKRLDVANKFPEVALPDHTDFLDDQALVDDQAAAALEYLNKRSPLFMTTDDSSFFMWTPLHPEYVILPYIHYDDSIVGYMGRHIGLEKGPERFIQRSPPDFMFNQYLLSTHRGKYVFVMESPMDAVLMRGLGVRSNRLTQKQINLLNRSGKSIVLIPDQRYDEAGPFFTAAKDNDWYVSVPEWGGKDVGESITNNGLLSTIELITLSMTKNYIKAKSQLGIKG